MFEKHSRGQDAPPTLQQMSTGFINRINLLDTTDSNKSLHCVSIQYIT